MDATAAATFSSPEDIPLIVWTNGGPGCTAMEGATTENGPLVLYRIKESYELATGQLSDNAYAWNKQGHVLYVDQPMGVGNSFGANKCTSSVQAGEDIVTFLEGWLNIFPQYATNKMVISGESYGGHYVPAWANAILDYNEDHSPGLNLRGIAIGNGCINNTVQDTPKFVEFLHANNLIPSDAAPVTQVGANAQMEEYIGYSPNFYDFRVRDVKCSGCYSYNYTEWSYWFLKDEVIDALNICGGAGYDAFAGSAGG
jgi:carboxypeptidase C (cathepsin A)